MRSQTINPISCEETSRRFYTNISNLTAQDKIQLNGPMKKAVGQLADAFKQDIGDTATSAGVGDQYTQAMEQYARAKQIQNATKTAAKVVGGAALGGGILYPALQALRDLVLK